MRAEDLRELGPCGFCDEMVFRQLPHEGMDVLGGEGEQLEGYSWFHGGLANRVRRSSPEFTGSPANLVSCSTRSVQAGLSRGICDLAPIYQPVNGFFVNDPVAPARTTTHTGSEAAEAGARMVNIVNALEQRQAQAGAQADPMLELKFFCAGNGRAGIQVQGPLFGP